VPLCRQIGSLFTDFLLIEVMILSFNCIKKFSYIFFRDYVSFGSIVFSDCRFVSIVLYSMNDKEYHA
jgi:hypothetical protein